jgi:hypothetical protein
MDHEPWSMVQDRITERNNMTKKTIKTRVHTRRSETTGMLDKAVDYLRTPGATQQIKHEFCLTYLNDDRDRVS